MLVYQRVYGHGSIPFNGYINSIFGGMNIHKSQLFWCERKGYKVLTHPQITQIKLKILGVKYLEGLGRNSAVYPSKWFSDVLGSCTQTARKTPHGNSRFKETPRNTRKHMTRHPWGSPSSHLQKHKKHWNNPYKVDICLCNGSWNSWWSRVT